VKKLKKITLLVLLLAVTQFSFAQLKEDSVRLNGKYFLGYFKDTWSMIKSPSKWDNDDWTNFGLTGGLAFTAYMFDHDVISWMKNNRSDGTNTISDFFEPLGRSSSFMPFSLVIGTYGIGALTQSYRLKKTSLLALESFAVSGFFVQALKFSINRARPYYGSHSFPSGHSAAVFAVASVFAYEYKDKIWLGTALYVAATLTALSRVNDLRHYPSDVIIGSAMGYFMGRYISKIHDPHKSMALNLYPAFYNKSLLIGLSYHFK